MNNLLIESFRQSIVQVINNSQLPLGVVYFVLRDTLKEIEDMYGKQVQKEKEQYLKTQEQKKKQGGAEVEQTVTAAGQN